MSARAKKTDHIVMHMGKGGRLGCLHCGQNYTAALPAPVDIVIAAGKAFEKAHVRCRKPASGLRCAHCLQMGHEPTACPELDVKTIAEWLKGPDTGTSSRTIVAAIHGSWGWGGVERGSVPCDPDDFGRCHRLLERFPELRADFPTVATKYPEWAPFVREWPKLEALYREEVPTGTGAAPKLYAAMKKCSAEAGLR